MQRKALDRQQAPETVVTFPNAHKGRQLNRLVG